MRLIDVIVTSRITVKVLDYFCSHSEQSSTRGVARAIGEDPGNVSKTINKLAKQGILERIEEGSRVYYIAPRTNDLWHIKELLGGER